MKKNIVLLLSLITLITLPSLVSARTVKIGDAYAGNHPLNIALIKFGEIVDKETKGALKIDVLHSGMLGGEMELIQQVLGGTLDGALIGGSNMFSNYDQRATVEDVPFLIKNKQMGRKVMAGPYGKAIATQVIEPLGSGVKVLAFFEHGFRQITNNKRPIVKPEDLKGIKLRTPSLPLRVETFKLLGANPTPMALPELFTALQQGTVDGQENPLVTIETSKFYEVQKYLSLSNHTYTSAPVIVGKKVWDSFSENEQKVLLKASAEAASYILDVNDSEETRVLAIMKKAGMKVNDIDYNAFVKAVQPVWESYKKTKGAALLNMALETGK